MAVLESAQAPNITVDKIAEEKKKRQKPRPHGARQPFFIELSRLMVVAIKASSSQLVYKAQTKPSGPWETDWAPVDTTQTYKLMTAGITGDGHVAVVAQPASAPGVFYIDEKPIRSAPRSGTHRSTWASRPASTPLRIWRWRSTLTRAWKCSGPTWAAASGGSIRTPIASCRRPSR